MKHHGEPARQDICQVFFEELADRIVTLAPRPGGECFYLASDTFLRLIFVSEILSSLLGGKRRRGP